MASSRERLSGTEKDRASFLFSLIFFSEFCEFVLASVEF